MNRFRKTIAAGMSAMLLASLFTVIAASTAFASVTVTGVGSVPRGGTSAGPASFLFTESDINTLTTAGGSFSVYIFDAGANCANTVVANAGFATVHFTGTGTQSGPGSLDLSALVVGDNFFTIKTNNADNLNVETILIGGLSIKADAAAQLGNIKACVYNDTGIFAAAFATGTATATGKLVGATGVGATAFNIAVDVGSCPFVSLPSGTLGPIKIGTDSITTATVSALGATVPGQQDVTGAAPALAATHLANDVVTEKVTNCTATTLGSPGTVVDSLKYNDPGTPTRVNPGESNQAVANLSATERTAGFLTAASTLTLTITTPGVTFSAAPVATATGGLLFAASPAASASVFGTLSADRMSATWTVDTKSTTASTITWSQIMYDVAATVATGTAINVTLAASAGVVTPTSRSNAVVGRVLTVSSSGTPVVYIGENNQTAGQVTIVETGKGFFTDGAGANNAFSICLFTGEQFASAPWAKVTAGDLKLREGTTFSPDNVVVGTPIVVAGIPFACYYWTVWTASTVASTVVISGDEAGTTGVKINVPPGSSVGPVDVSIRTGSVATMFNPFVFEGRVAIALRQFRNQVVVTALSQPTIPVGSNGSAAGDISIQETANGQLKFGERVCVEILPNQNAGALYDAFMKGLNTADVPIATASNGVVITGVTMGVPGRTCNGTTFTNPANLSLVVTFSFFVQQQSITGNGKVVISNIKYATVNDAVPGPVQVNVFGFGQSNTLIDFQALISNARIGSVVAGTAATRLGVTQTGAFTTSTKVPHVNGYVTYRIDFGIAAAGAHVDIWGATKTGNDWSAFAKVTTRVANASGVVYYYIRQGSPTWKSYRGNWVGGGVWSPARQAHWVR